MKYLIVVCLMLLGSSLWAQDEPPPAEYIIQGTYIAQFQWLSDGQVLKVIEGFTLGDERHELTYQMDSRPLEAPNNLTPAFEPPQILTSKTSPITDMSSTVVYQAPNGQLAVLATQQERGYRLTIQDLTTTRNQAVLDIPVSAPYSARHFRVNWSEDSSAFYAFVSNNPATYWYYVSDFTYELENASAVLLNDQRNEGIVNQAIGEVVEVYDIDTQGTKLLIGRLTRTPDTSSLVEQLVVLNMKTLTYEILVESPRSLAGAIFGQSGAIYYISFQGLFVYDLESGTSQLLDANINSNWAIRAEISPDGRYVAATEQGRPDRIYVIAATP